MGQDVLEIGLHRPMMGPLVSHEIMKLFTRVVAAMTAEVKPPVAGALSECALFSPIVGPVAQAAVAVRCSAGAAKEAAGSAFLGFHRRPFSNSDYTSVMFSVTKDTKNLPVMNRSYFVHSVPFVAKT